MQSLIIIKRNTIIWAFAVLIILSASVIVSWPICNVAYNTEGKMQFCRYQLAVHTFSYIESEGEGEPKSDTYIGNIILHKKIGGVLEYLGLKKINLDNNYFPNPK